MTATTPAAPATSCISTCQASCTNLADDAYTLALHAKEAVTEYFGKSNTKPKELTAGESESKKAEANAESDDTKKVEATGTSDETKNAEPTGETDEAKNVAAEETKVEKTSEEEAKAVEDTAKETEKEDSSKDVSEKSDVTENDAKESEAVVEKDATQVQDLSLKNSAFVFIKPHANTIKTQEFVKGKLEQAGLTILSECDIDGPTIDQKKLIDQHYYAIASKATILPAKDIPVPTDKFEAEFGEAWSTVLAEDRACNAMEACERFQCSDVELNEAWQKANAVKFGGGFYCAHFAVKEDGPKLYVFNAFFMTMRSKFCKEGTSIHGYEVEWNPSVLAWTDFRNKLLGPTDPADAPADSIRGTILAKYEEFGLTSVPNKGDNGVHASASPFEGLAEKANWLERSVEEDALGKALISKGLSLETIKAWSVDPRIKLPTEGSENAGQEESVFDALEDMDVEDCFAMLLKLKEMNL